MIDKDPRTSQSKSFEVFQNAISVGWHLRKIQEADPTFMDKKEDWEKFIEWLERHNIKKWDTK